MTGSHCNTINILHLEKCNAFDDFELFSKALDKRDLIKGNKIYQTMFRSHHYKHKNKKNNDNYKRKISVESLKYFLKQIFCIYNFI